MTFMGKVGVDSALNGAETAALVCASCRGELNSVELGLRCTDCGRVFDTCDGFPDFVGEEDLDWGELESEQMKQVVQHARRVAWYAPLLELGEKDPFLAYYILDRSRAGWVFHCLRPTNNEVCVDLGSGWGNIAFTLADLYKTVWSVETVRARVEFQTIRREQEGRNNIHPVRSTLLSLPFAENTADLVVCNGVLEWIGLSDFDQPVETLQMNFLREAFRVLKPGGCLYIGIENRYSALSFLGAIDHSGLPFTNLLPRPLADIIVRRFRPRGKRLTTRQRSQTVWRDYRSYTYSLSGYHRLLYRAGFNSIEDYWVWPNYNAPHYSGRFHDDSLKFLVSNIVSGSRNRLARLGGFCFRVLPMPVSRFLAQKTWPSFLLFAFKQVPKKRLKDNVLTSSSTGVVLATTARISAPKHAYFVLKKGKVTKTVSICNEDKLEPTSRSVGPPVEVGRLGNFGLSINSGVDGKPLNPRNPRQSKMAIEWLVDFQRHSAQRLFTEQEWERESILLMEFLREQEDAEELVLLVTSVLRNISDLVRKRTLQVTAEHGDFQYRNVLLDADGNLHVVDWDDSRPVGNPLFDVGTYLLTLARGSRADLYEMVRGRGPLARSVSAVLQAYSKGVGWTTPNLDGLVGYALIRMLYRDTITLSANGKSKARAFPGASALALATLKALPDLSESLTDPNTGEIAL